MAKDNITDFGVVGAAVSLSGNTGTLFCVEKVA